MINILRMKMVKRAGIAVLLFAASLIYGSNAYDKYCPTTPETFEADYKEHCAERLPNLGEGFCKDNAWPTFAASFAFKDPETVSAGDYAEYFQVIPIETNPNQNLFWSGTFKLVDGVSEGANLVSSSNTPSAAIVNDLGRVYWCGHEDDGIDYVNQCLCNVSFMFWVQFSIDFAKAAEGTIFYLAYGEREGGPFSTTSIFAEHELPNMQYPRVTAAVVLDIHQEGQGEACGEGSLIELKNVLLAKQFQYSCYDIYGDLSDPDQKNDLIQSAVQIILAIKNDAVTNSADFSPRLNINQMIEAYVNGYY